MNQFELQAATSFLLGTTYSRICMALDLETNSDTYDAIKELKTDLDRNIGRLYYPVHYPNPLSSET